MNAIDATSVIEDVKLGSEPGACGLSHNSSSTSSVADRVGLRVRELSKHFCSPSGTELRVLRDVSFDVGPGEMVAIAGKSGAGKSTLLHLLGGLEAADSGTIDLKGAGAPLRGEIGFLFQFHHLLSDLTVVENVALPLLMRRRGMRDSQRAATAILEELDLQDRLDHRIAELSGGEQQRVALARALVTQPPLVLADEPTGNLDSGRGIRIGGMLMNYARQHRAIVVLATHNLELAGVSDRTLMLNQGSIVSIMDTPPY